MRGQQVIAEIVHPERVVYQLHLSGVGVLECGAVFGDVDRHAAVPIADPGQHRGKRGRVDFPVHGRVERPRLLDPARTYRQCRGIITGDASGVVVDAEEVERLLDQGKIFVGKGWPVVAKNLRHFLGIVTKEYRVEELPVHVRVGAPGRSDVGGMVRGGIFRFEVHDQARLAATFGPNRLHSGAVGPEQVVARQRGFGSALVAGGMDTVQVPGIGHDPRLIERGPHGHPVAQRVHHDAGVVGEPAGDIAIEPATRVVESGRQVPVVECDGRCDAELQQAIHQLIVKRESSLVDEPPSGRQDAAPRYAEPVGSEAQFAHQEEIVGEAPVVITGHVAGIAVGNPARLVDEAVPDAGPGAIGERRALDLVGRGRSAPEEAGGEADSLRHRGRASRWLG